MFIGHFGIGFGAKKIAPAISLGLLFIAAQFLDLLWPSLLLLDIEHVVISPGITKVTPFDFVDYPISHSLLLVTGWGILLGILSWLFLKRFRYALIIFACVVSHWLLDLLVHRPDLPLAPGSDSRYGLGIWNYPVLTGALEGLIFLSGVYLYSRSTNAKNNFGKYGLLTLAGMLLIIQAANMFGPPPPNMTAIAWAGQLQWLFVILAFYVDKNREMRINKS
ncbi:MAG: hypothetical protein IPI66_08415 [Chitinophagaceae bacterium]|nr:hypothetical protein [Chitinophagaceae bacterium]MBL0056999.1 hypothetical protein [Chitinophagaceae bacterium]